MSVFLPLDIEYDKILTFDIKSQYDKILAFNIKVKLLIKMLKNFTKFLLHCCSLVLIIFAYKY